MLEALVLAVVQGLTEFLPVSSSGHLILVREFFGFDTHGSLAFDALLHLATSLAVVVYFRKDLARVVASLFHPSTENRTLLWALVFGTVPAAVAGFLLEGFVETSFRDGALVAWALIAGSLLFIAAEKWGKADKALTSHSGFWIGVFQALALIPGISRSGASISGGLLLGMPREEATRFAFLLSFPILFGAGLKKLFDVLGGSAAVALGPAVLGSITAFLIGILAIHFMLQFLKHHTLYPFVVYRVALALLIIFAAF